jgi:hypothetical protein
MLDISNPLKPQKISRLDSNKNTNNKILSIYSKYAYLIDEDGIIHIFDISYPKKPKKLNKFVKIDKKIAIFSMHNNHAYYSDGTRNLYITSISGIPPLPIIANLEKKFFCLPDRIRGISLKDAANYTYIYIANDDAGLQIIRQKK